MRAMVFGRLVGGMALGALLLGGALCPPSVSAAETLTLDGINPRLIFDDTSDPASTFPSNDWRLIANETSSGSRDLFAVEDTTAATMPFIVAAGAPSNSLFVASNGRIGLRKPNPVLDLHIETTNTPGIRLEQSSAGGFTAETWDIAGNETNFFIRDVTNGSKLPFRIRPGAPTSAIDIAADGDVGIGNSSPSHPLHIRRNDGSARLMVEERNGTSQPLLPLDLAAGDLALLDLSGRTSAFARFANIDGGQQWLAGAAQDGSFTIGNGSPATTRFTLGAGGQLALAGSLSQLADAAARSDVAAVNHSQILSQLRSLPLSTYRDSSDAANRQHIGPNGADFFGQFGFGSAEQVAPADLAGVALAASKAIDEDVSELAARVDGVETSVGSNDAGARLTALEADLAALEDRVGTVETTANSAKRGAKVAKKKAAKAGKAAKTALKKLKKLSKR